jgi:predicted peroxiredoxin
VPTSLVVKATAGVDFPDRCEQAFRSAVVAAADGVTVSFWLAGEASWFALPGRADALRLSRSDVVSDLLRVLINRSRVTLCKHCAARRSISPSDLLPGIRIAGPPVFVEECLEATQAVVY